MPTVWLLLTLLTRLVHTPRGLIVRLSDEADEVWEPFLTDDDAAVAF